MNPLLKDYLTYSRAQRSGLLFLLTLIIVIQALYCFVDFPAGADEDPEKQHWLSLQSGFDSLRVEKANRKPTIYPFNPNFITDFKGYKLGMSVEEIDKLHAFRNQDKYVNSAAEFQNVTGISDSLLHTMSPYFKFPDWVTNRKAKPFSKFPEAARKAEKIIAADINAATKEDLIKIYGIGPALSDRILKQKELLGAFVSMKQMEDIWGLSPEVIENLNKYFKVGSVSGLRKIRVNDASVKELAQFPYFKYKLAKQIVTHRSMNGDLKSSADLAKINDFPVDKAEIIALYLEF